MKRFVSSDDSLIDSVHLGHKPIRPALGPVRFPASLLALDAAILWRNPARAAGTQPLQARLCCSLAATRAHARRRRGVAFGLRLLIVWRVVCLLVKRMNLAMCPYTCAHTWKRTPRTRHKIDADVIRICLCIYHTYTSLTSLQECHNIACDTRLARSWNVLHA